MTTQPNIEQATTRQALFRQLTSVPHRDYDALVSSFEQAMAQDPDFAARTMVYLASGNTNIRDQADAAVITLLRSDPAYPEYREAGRCLLLGNDFYRITPADVRYPGLPPFRVFRVVEWIAKQGNRNSPRLLKTIANDFLKGLEKNTTRFDGVAIRNRKSLKGLYTHYHIPMDERAEAILIHREPPPDSQLAVLRLISESTDPKEQAELVMKNRIPYTVAASVLPKVSPVVGIALIDVMTPQEALNSRAWVEESGLLEVPEVRTAYESKVAKATASAATTDFRKSTQGSDAGVETAVAKAREKAVASQQRIQKNTLLLVDKSGSMESYFSVAQEIGSRIAPLCDGEFACFLFNEYAQKLEVTEKTLDAWKKAFRPIRADGATSIESGLNKALQAGCTPEQVIIVTDGEENRGLYADAVQRYYRQTGVQLHTVIIYMNETCRRSALSRTMNAAGLRFDDFIVDGKDWYVYDQIAAILGGPPAQTIVDRILDIPFPRRATWTPR